MKYLALFIVLVLARNTIPANIASEVAKRHLDINAKTSSSLCSAPSSIRHHDHDLSVNYAMSATTNWAGATIDMPRGNASEINNPAIGSVKAQWSIPRLCLREGQNISSAGTLQTWIGISGKECEPKGAMVQVGIKAVVRGTFIFIRSFRFFEFPSQGLDLRFGFRSWERGGGV